MQHPAKGVTMEKLSIWFGAIVAAFGVTWLVWDVVGWTSDYTPSLPFWLAATLAGAGWALTTFGPHGRSPSWWSGLRALLQRLFVVAVVFLGLSASCAPFRPPEEEKSGYRAAMKSDLRNLVNAQLAFAADSGRYASSIPAALYRTSSGILGPIIALTADGWTASVDHTHSPQTCVIFIGTTPLAPAMDERVPTCTRLSFPMGSAVWGLSIVGIGLVLAAYGIWPTKRSA